MASNAPGWRGHDLIGICLKKVGKRRDGKGCVGYARWATGRWKRRSEVKVRRLCSRVKSKGKTKPENFSRTHFRFNYGRLINRVVLCASK